jgi:hypothetical protein
VRTLRGSLISALHKSAIISGVAAALVSVLLQRQMMAIFGQWLTRLYDFYSDGMPAGAIIALFGVFVIFFVPIYAVWCIIATFRQVA